MSTVFRPSVARSCFNSLDGRPTGRDADRQRLAPAASSLRQTAATAAASTASAPPTTSAPSTASAASPRKLHAGLRCSGVFLVEDIEGRQADVGNFLLAERNHRTRCDVLRGNIRHRRRGRSAACHRQRHPGDSERRQGLPYTLSLRSLLRMRHSGDLLYLRRKCSTNGTVPVAQIRLLMPITICWFPSGAAIGQKQTTPSRGSGPLRRRTALCRVPVPATDLTIQTFMIG
jgi:hypothetical protein